MTPKNSEIAFRRYLRPKWETEQDIDLMKRNFYNKKRKNDISANVEKHEEDEKRKFSELSNSARLYMSKLNREDLQNLRERAEKTILELTK